MIRILLLFCALPAFSQVLELAVGGGQSRLSNAGLGQLDATSTQQNDYSLKGGYRINFRMTTNSGDFTGHEFGYAYNRTQLLQNNTDGSNIFTGMAIHQGFYNYHRTGVVHGPGDHREHFIQIRQQPILRDNGDVARRQERDEPRHLRRGAENDRTGLCQQAISASDTDAGGGTRVS